MTARLRSVNVVHALIPDKWGSVDQTAIDKRPVPGRITVRRLGVEGDRQYDTRHHGGPDQAVYAYAGEDLDCWAGELGRELRPGAFGENLSTEGVDVTGAVIGERWRIGAQGSVSGEMSDHADEFDGVGRSGGSGGVVVEVTMPRIPCATFQGFMGEPRWVKRFFAHGAPGAYLRVLAEGTVAAGDSIEVHDRPAHGVTIGEVFAGRHVDPERLRLLVAQPGLARSLVEALERTLKAATS